MCSSWTDVVNSYSKQNDRGRSEHCAGPFQVGNGRDGQQYDGPASRCHRQSFTTDLQFFTQTSNDKLVSESIASL